MAQKETIDSLQNFLKTSKADTEIAKICNKISRKLYLTGNFDSAYKYAMQAKTMAEKYPGWAGSKKTIAKAFSNLGSINLYQGNYPGALKNFLASLKIKEEVLPSGLQVGDKQTIAAGYSNIGMVYQHQSNFKEALKYHFIAVKIQRENEIKEDLAISYNNIGIIYTQMNLYSEALNYHLNALQIETEIGDKEGVSNSYNNIGILYGYQKKYPEAIKSNLSALKMQQDIGDRQGISTSYVNLGVSYVKLNKYNKAEEYTIKSLILAKEIGDLETCKEAAQNLSEIFANTKRDKGALTYYKEYIIYRDSIFNEENTKKTVREQMQYDFDKKETSAKLEQEKKEAIAEADSRRQKIIIWSVSGVLALVFAFAVFAYRSYLQKRKANIEITKQKHLIEEKQKEILDSIYYARRIQRSLLTSEKYIAGQLKKLIKD